MFSLEREHFSVLAEQFNWYERNRDIYFCISGNADKNNVLQIYDLYDMLKKYDANPDFNLFLYI